MGILNGRFEEKKMGQIFFFANSDSLGDNMKILKLNMGSEMYSLRDI